MCNAKDIHQSVISVLDSLRVVSYVYIYMEHLCLSNKALICEDEDEDEALLRESKHKHLNHRVQYVAGYVTG
jgi:hypothetical protein